VPVTTRDRVLPALNRARAIVDRSGLRRYSLAIITRSWSGGAIGSGTPTDTRLVITPRPEVGPAPERALREFETGGAITLGQQAWMVTDITPEFAKATRAVTHTGSGTGTMTVASSIPTLGVTSGSWSLVVTIMVSGSPGGTATFQYSTDGGTTFSATQAMTSTFQVPGIGMLLTFSGPFVAGDTYSVPGESGGYQPEQLRPSTASPEVQTLYELTGDEGPFLVTLARMELDRAFHATLYLDGGRFFP
jgi:hypothetical protein